MIITLAPALRLRNDRDCYVLEEETIAEAKGKLPKRKVWTFIGYYHRPEAAFERAVRCLLARYPDAVPIEIGEYVRRLREAAAEVRSVLDQKPHAEPTTLPGEPRKTEQPGSNPPEAPPAPAAVVTRKPRKLE